MPAINLRRGEGVAIDAGAQRAVIVGACAARVNGWVGGWGQTPAYKISLLIFFGRAVGRGIQGGRVARQSTYPSTMLGRRPRAHTLNRHLRREQCMSARWLPPPAARHQGRWSRCQRPHSCCDLHGGQGDGSGWSGLLQKPAIGRRCSSWQGIRSKQLTTMPRWEIRAAAVHDREHSNFPPPHPPAIMLGTCLGTACMGDRNEAGSSTRCPALHAHPNTAQGRRMVYWRAAGLGAG